MANVAEMLPPERTDEVLAQIRLPAAPAAGDAGDRQLHQCRAAGEDEADGAWLLNFGRGHLIKDDDLIAAVKAKKIAGAVLDVFRQEPLPAEHPFWKTDGILVLPHIGGPHPQRDRFVARLFVDNLGRFLDGAPLKEVVDRDGRLLSDLPPAIGPESSSGFGTIITLVVLLGLLVLAIVFMAVGWDAPEGGDRDVGPRLYRHGARHRCDPGAGRRPDGPDVLQQPAAAATDAPNGRSCCRWRPARRPSCRATRAGSSSPNGTASAASRSATATRSSC